MGVAIGAYKFNELRGTPPILAEAGVVLQTRAGTGGVGGRVQPATGREHEVTVVRVTTAATRFSTQYGYRAAIGTVVDFDLDGTSWATTYGFNFFILGIDILESRPLVRSVGLDPDGVEYDYSPAGLIVSRWRMVSVPSS